MAKFKPVENERYSAEKDGEWFVVKYTRLVRGRIDEEEHIAHYEKEEKAERIASVLNDNAEI